MLFRTAILLFPLVALAQAPPPDVDDALRTRVSAFLQAHVDGNFRKAFEYVAEDTKDYYFSAGKTRYTSFHIDKIDFSKDFTEADVVTTVETSWTFQGHTMPVKKPIVTTWVLHGGKWCWHFDPLKKPATPMGPSDPNTLKNDNANGAPVELTPAAIAERAHQILGQSNVDKSEVILSADKSSSDQVVFHNGYPGSVRVLMNPGPAVPGFQAQLEKADVGAGGDSVIKLSYQPSGSAPSSPVNIRLVVEPFNTVFNVTVKFTPSGQQ